MENLKPLLDFLEKFLPLICMFFGIGFLDGKRREGKLKKELLDSETKRKLLENEITVDQGFSGKSDIDVIRSITGTKPDVK